jgi:YVTN family beta-propeller protein
VDVRRILLPAGALLAVALVLVSRPVPRAQVGPLDDGGFLLNTGWVVRPAGRQVALTDTLPMSLALSPDGAWVAVLSGGYTPPAISIFNSSTWQEASRLRVTDAFLGLAFSPAGNKLYVGGGADASVLELNLAAGKLTSGRRFVVPAKAKTSSDFVGDVALSPDGATLYAADLYNNSIAVIDVASGTVKSRVATGARPYRVRFHYDGASYFVSGWGDGTVYQHDLATGKILAKVAVGAHPTDMVWRANGLFVAAANTNAVYKLEPVAGGGWKVGEVIGVAFTPRQPVGMTPSALAVSPDATRLYVVCSDANVVAVASVGGSATAVLGFVPVGWYPTAVLAMPDGRLVVANGKGGRSYPNARGTSFTYVASQHTGTLSVIDPFDQAALDGYFGVIAANTPYRDYLLDDAGTGEGSPVPARPGDASPIRHVLYIIKENRTYDQVLGDMPQGNGDASLALFGEQITPNHHKLAREFVLLDNYYVNSDVSADGHNWAMAAIAPDWTQKTWPSAYAGRLQRTEYGPGPDAVAVAGAPGGYLWTRAFDAGLTLRSYGYPTGDARFAKYNAPGFMGFNPNVPDTDRAPYFLKELAQFEQSGSLPQFILVYLGGDHTNGATAGALAPASCVAANDAALGQIVEALSRSRFWADTAIFVTEDDAQNGPDHVDAHRSPGFVLSPYTRRGVVDSTMYSQVSMVRTMGLILGLAPLTHFDAGARPMASVFQNTPDLTPYVAEPPRVSLTDRNPGGTANAAASARMDFSRPDANDDDEMNAVLWRMLRGTEPPPPRHNVFPKLAR